MIVHIKLSVFSVIWSELLMTSTISYPIVLMVEGMSVVVNIMLSPMNLMSPPPALYNLSVHTVMKLCTWVF